MVRSLFNSFPAWSMIDCRWSTNSARDGSAEMKPAMFARFSAFSDVLDAAALRLCIVTAIARCSVAR